MGLSLRGRQGLRRLSRRSGRALTPLSSSLDNADVLRLPGQAGLFGLAGRLGLVTAQAGPGLGNADVLRLSGRVGMFGLARRLWSVGPHRRGEDLRLDRAAAGERSLDGKGCPGFACTRLDLAECRISGAFGATRPVLDRRPTATRNLSHARRVIGLPGNRVVPSGVRAGMHRLDGFTNGRLRYLLDGSSLPVPGRRNAAGVPGALPMVNPIDMRPFEVEQCYESRHVDTECKLLGAGHRTTKPLADQRAGPACVAFGLLGPSDEIRRATQTGALPNPILEERGINLGGGLHPGPGQANAVPCHGSYSF